MCSLLFVILLSRTEQNNKITNICSNHDLLTKTKTEGNTNISCFFMTPPRNRTTESLGCRSRWMGITQTSGNGPPLHSRANTEHAYTGADNSCKKIIHSMRSWFPGKGDFPRNMGLIKIRNRESPRTSWKTLENQRFLYNSKNGCRIPEAPILNP